MPLDGVGGGPVLPQRVRMALPREVEPDSPEGLRMRGEVFARGRGAEGQPDWSSDVDFDALNEQVEAAAAPPEIPNFAPELQDARFLNDCCLKGDCAVQAFLQFGGAQAQATIEQVRRGLQNSDAPFEVTVSRRPTTEGGDRKVVVDPKVYQALQQGAPDGPGLSPEQAFTMVTRLAVAQAIDPGATMVWEDDGQGGGVMALDGSKEAAGQGLHANAVTSFAFASGLPILDTAGIGRMMALATTPQEREAVEGQSFLAFLTDPATGTAHPEMVTARFNHDLNPPELRFEVPGRTSMSMDDMGDQMMNYFRGAVAPNSGWGTTGGKTPKRWPG